ncbi:ABC transporter permease [Naasia sp. SYSU D00057]|uniref:ABC transporter permease n=1 Tax=Naasia sp. SYSU D00057 TaxID=2817380 RepID=UPI001B314A58|nr:ABC transporter permease [Naasia sp. SYSU D00057]
MSRFLSGVGTVLALELRQRVRARGWYILLGVYVLLIGIVTLLLSLSLGTFAGGDAGSGVLSTIIYFVLLLGTLVTPALSGNAINGDRTDGTLATTQVTQISTGQLVVGKFVAAWVSALAFLAASVPFLLGAVLLGGVRADTALVSIVVLAVELGVVAAIGVGLSGLLARPLFSIVVTYLVVAALSIGTLILFTLAGLATQSTVTSTYRYAESIDEDGDPVCSAVQEDTYTIPRFDPYWGVLVANPYVVLADAVPTAFDDDGNPVDLFGFLKTGVRQAQIPPDLDVEYDDCAGEFPPSPTAQEIIERTVPGWFVGLGLHALLAGGLLAAGWSATRTPARRLARGSRIA